MKDINLFKTKGSIFLKKISTKSELSEDSYDGYLIDSSEKEARRIIESLKTKKGVIALVGGDDTFNRRAIETLKINYLLSPEKKTANNTLKQRDSGLNHVIAKEAAKRNITILIDFAKIQKLSGKEKSLHLEKLIQNIKICRKAKCKIKIASLASNKMEVVDEKSRSAFGVSLGMSSAQARDSTQF